MGSNPSASTNGDEREMESGLIFNQLICEFESRHPCQIYVGCSSMAEHRTVTAAYEGSTPFDPPNLRGTVAER